MTRDSTHFARSAQSRTSCATSSANGLHHLVCQGVQRFRIVSPVEGHPFLAVRIQRIDEPTGLSAEGEALGMQLHERVVEILSLLPGVPAEFAHALQATRAPGQLADIAASLIVMGAYGHTRIREIVLGGATRTVLSSMTVPVLMSH